MKQYLLFGLLLVASSALGFMGTQYFLLEDATDKPVNPASSRIIYQEYEDLSPNELVLRGEKLLKGKEYDKASTVFEMAHDKARPRSRARINAAIYLGGNYFTGKGRPKDRARSYHYYTSEKIDSYRQIQYRLGVILSDENFPQYDIEKARKYLISAESKGIKAATTRLAQIGRQ